MTVSPVDKIVLACGSISRSTVLLVQCTIIVAERAKRVETHSQLLQTAVRDICMFVRRLT